MASTNVHGGSEAPAPRESPTEEGEDGETPEQDNRTDSESTSSYSDSDYE